MIKNFKLLLLISLGLVACTQDEEDVSGILPEEPPVTAGSADFSKYVALGNSLTAGFSDNALFIKSQENSYAKLLANQFELAGGGEFKIPYMNDNVGGLLFGGVPNASFAPRLVIEGFVDGSPVIKSLIQPPFNQLPTTEAFNVIAGPFNNLGVPGAKSFHLLAQGYGNPANLPAAANPYFVRMASSPGTSILQDAISQNPTFFSLWIGNNDVLGYATSGGTGTNQTGNLNPATYGLNDISDPAVFDNVYGVLIDGLTTNGAKGVVANIPYVTSIPFFTTVPHNPVPLDESTANAVNQAFAQYNGGLLVAESMNLISASEREARTIQFAKINNNRLLIVDEYLTDLSGLGLPSYRQATKDDLILLTTRSIIGTMVGGNPQLINGVTVPLTDAMVLSKGEVAEIKTAVDAYNVSIKAKAEAKGLAFVDVNAVLTQLSTTGIRFDNFHMTNGFVSGGAFSLDGVHVTARGNAYIANKFAEAINATYGSTLRMNKMKDFQFSYPLFLN